METPRFFRQDDEVVISTIVHNYLSESKVTKIHFESNKLKLINSMVDPKKVLNNKDSNTKDTYEILIPANTELRIDWKCKVDYPTGDATIKASALTNEE